MKNFIFGLLLTTTGAAFAGQAGLHCAYSSLNLSPEELADYETLKAKNIFPVEPYATLHTDIISGNKVQITINSNYDSDNLKSEVLVVDTITTSLNVNGKIVLTVNNNQYVCDELK